MEQHWVASQRKAAAALGFRAHRAVQKAIESGRIPEHALRRDAAGRVTAIEVNAARQALAVNTDPAHQSDEAAAVRGASRSAGRGNELLQARAKEKFYSAQLRELEYLRQAGALVSADEVKKAAQENGRRWRNELLALEDRICSLVDQRTRQAINAEFRKLLDRNGYPSRLREAAGADEREPALQ